MILSKMLWTRQVGSPIELNLDFSAQNTDLSMFAYVRSNYHLNIGSTGSVTMTEGSH